MKYLIVDSGQFLMYSNGSGLVWSEDYQDGIQFPDRDSARAFIKNHGLNRATVSRLSTSSENGE